MQGNFFVHPTADVSLEVQIGEGTKIWQHYQVREGAVAGHNCILSKSVYVDSDVHIGNNVKIQNGVSVYHGVTLEDGVFCSPHCVFTNDKQPRAINPDGTLKNAADWAVSETRVRGGESSMKLAVIGAGAMGRNHVRVYSEMPDVELVGIADTDTQTTGSLARGA
jgi:acetyltransferase-like isoleucine patch superfamily enzyme